MGLLAALGVGRYAVRMEKRMVLVALALGLALGCGDEQLVVDAGSDAGVVLDEGVPVPDMAPPRDMGEPCESELPCIQRWRVAGGVCFVQIQENFPCDDGDERTYDDRCDEVGLCEGITCECGPALDPCCDGCHTLPIGTVCEWGHPYPAGACIQVPGESRVRCSVTP